MLEQTRGSLPRTAGVKSFVFIIWFRRGLSMGSVAGYAFVAKLSNID